MIKVLTGDHVTPTGGRKMRHQRDRLVDTENVIEPLMQLMACTFINGHHAPFRSAGSTDNMPGLAMVLDALVTDHVDTLIGEDAR